MAEDYEILPHQLLEDLKFDVEALKKKLTEPEAKANELILEIETLKDSIHELNGIFNKALDHAKEEDAFKAIQRLNERIDTVVTQNETIAKGMIAISDKLEEFMKKNAGPAHSTLAKPSMPGLGMPPGPMSGMPGGLSSPAMRQHFSAPQMSARTLPPPPSPGGKRRRGLF